MCEEEIFVGDFGLPHGPVYPLHTRARVKAKARVRVALPRRACRRSPAYRMHRQWTFGTTRFFFFLLGGNRTSRVVLVHGMVRHALRASARHALRATC